MNRTSIFVAFESCLAGRSLIGRVKQSAHALFRLMAAFAWTLGALSGVMAQTSAAPLALPSFPWSNPLTPPPNIILTLDDSGSMNEPVPFNPNITYKVPIKQDGTVFPTPGPDWAWSNGFKYEDPAQPRYQFKSSEAICFIPVIRGNQSAEQYHDDNSCVCGMQPWHQRQNCTIWFSYYRTKLMTTKSSALLALETLPDEYRIAWQALNSCSFSNMNCNGELGRVAEKKFALRDWIINLNANGNTPLRNALWQAGNYLTQPKAFAVNPNNPSAGTLSCRASYAITMTDGMWNERNSFNIKTDESSNQAFLPSTEIKHGNLRSFSNKPYIARAPFRDFQSNTLADIAFHFWITDLQPNLANNVQPKLTVLDDPKGRLQDDEFWNPRNNPATWQSMTGFFIGLGLNSTLGNTGLTWDGNTFGGSFPSIEKGVTNWPSVSGSNASGRVSDLWHAAINSRGGLYMAENSQDLIAAFKSIQNIISGRQGSGSGGASSSLNIQEDSATFTALYDTRDGSGRLIRYNIANLAQQKPSSIDNEAWTTDATLPKRASPVPHFNAVVDCGMYPAWNMCSSKLWTVGRRPNQRVRIKPDDWIQLRGQLHPSVRNALEDQGTQIKSNRDEGAQSLLNWVLGLRSEEAPNGPFKARNTFLGDIIDSSPVFEAGRDYGYTTTGWSRVDPNNNNSSLGDGKSYSDFLTSQSKVGKTVYVGANDGMLHAFDADTGKLRFSWIPSPSLKKIVARAQNYGGRTWFVNGPIATHHAYRGGKWSTVLVASMGAGAKGLFALDVTNPNAPKPLWEWFPESGSDAADIGHVLGEPVIAAANRGRQWIVAFGNGYGSANNRSVLFVLDLFTGKRLLKTIAGAPNVQANGLSAPALLYLPGKELSAAYAGDLLGGLWRFDLSDIRAEDKTVRIPLFQARNDNGEIQPITAKPRIASDRTMGRFILFGTGRLLLSSDKSSIVRQSVYGIRDRLIDSVGAQTVQRADLLRQTITPQGQRRAVSLHNIDNTHGGWFIDLPDVGERVVGSITYIPELSTALVSSVLPVGTDPCDETNLDSWLMAISPFTGAGMTLFTDHPNTPHAGIKQTDASAPPTVVRHRGGIRLLFNQGVDGLAVRSATATRNPRSSWQQIR